MASIPHPISRWSTRAAAAAAAMTLVGVGMVGLAVPAAATPAECVPADAYSYTESIYTMTVQALTSPGEGWIQGAEVVVEDEAAYDEVQRRWFKWVGPRLTDFEYGWFPVGSPPGDPWHRTVTLPWFQTVTIDAVTHVEYLFTMTTGWLKESESPGEGWTVVDTQTIDVPEVVCGVPALQVDRTSQKRGGTVNLTALGFLDGESVEFVMNSTPVLLGVAVADGTGVAALGAVKIPTTAPVGTHTIVATGLDSERTASVSFEVLAVDTPAAAAAPAAPSSSLASTGGQFATLLGTAGALALAGIALVAVRRRSTVRA